MAEQHYIFLNSRGIPVKGDGESDADFSARMEYFRKHDNRIPVDRHGVVNFGFYRKHDGSGVVGRDVHDEPMAGSFSLGAEQSRESGKSESDGE